MNDQSQLLEQFIAALREDANALPPPGLDPDIADFTRWMMTGYAANTIPAADAVKERIWHRALNNARPAQHSTNGRYPNSTTHKEPMMILTDTHSPRRQSTLYTLLVAGLAVALVGGLLLFANRPQNNDPFSAMVIRQDATATPLPTATFVPTESFTETPFPPTAIPPENMQVSAVADISSAFDFNNAHPVNITLGQTTDGELTAENPAAYYSLTAGRDGYVFAQLVTDGGFSAVLGSGVSSPATGGGGGGGGGGSPDFTVPQAQGAGFAVRAGDSVTIAVGTQGGYGKFHITVTLAAAIPIEYGASIEGDLSPSAPTAYYTFDGDEGDVVTVAADGQNGFDTMLDLSAANQSLTVGQDDDGGPGYNPEIYQAHLSQAGRYAIRVQASSMGDSGHFKLSLSKDSPQSLDSGPVETQLSPKMYGPYTLTFTGHADQQVNLNVNVRRGDQPYSVLVTQAGQLIGEFDNNQPGQPAALPLNIPTDGMVSVVFNVPPSPVIGLGGALDLEVSLQPGS
jgi:pre-peptidase